MSRSPIPARSISLENGSTYYSVEEAARVSGLSTSTLYRSIKSGQIPARSLDGCLTLRAEDLAALQGCLQARARHAPPLWHRPHPSNPLHMTAILLRLHPGCATELEHHLSRFHTEARHLLTGTSARYLLRHPASPDRVALVLFWRSADVPDQDQCQRELTALASELGEVLAWEGATVIQGEVLLRA